jgi:hypothetical protein
MRGSVYFSDIEYRGASDFRTSLFFASRGRKFDFLKNIKRYARPGLSPAAYLGTPAGAAWHAAVKREAEEDWGKEKWR